MDAFERSTGVGKHWCLPGKHWFSRRKNKLRIQLTIASAQPEDSGIFHCILPSGKRNSIKIVVDGDFLSSFGGIKNISENSCQPLQNSSHLHVYFSRRQLFTGRNRWVFWEIKMFSGTIAQFSCPPGFRIHGHSTSTCQSDGTWSHPAPQCHGKPKSDWAMFEKSQCKECSWTLFDTTYWLASWKTKLWRFYNPLELCFKIFFRLRIIFSNIVNNRVTRTIGNEPSQFSNPMPRIFCGWSNYDDYRDIVQVWWYRYFPLCTRVHLDRQRKRPLYHGWDLES